MTNTKQKSYLIIDTRPGVDLYTHYQEEQKEEAEQHYASIPTTFCKWMVRCGKHRVTLRSGGGDLEEYNKPGL